MTIYLTKTVDGKTHHFRITSEDTGLEIIQGIFYISMEKYWQDFDTERRAQDAARKMIDEKIRDGYQVMPYAETPENSMDVYDKAKWHYGGDFPEDLDDFQGYIHTGMFLGWLIDQDLVSNRFKKEHEEEIKLFKEKKLSGAQVYQRALDGVLMLEDISELGNRFGIYYFNMDNGEYLVDYENILGANLPSLYHVQDTWDNYYKLKEMLDSKFAEWQQMIN
jgi:hypothetical protein